MELWGMRLVRRFHHNLAFLPFLMLLAACTGGGGGGGTIFGSGGSGGQDSSAEDLSPKTQFTDDDIRHFLARTQFGIRASEIQNCEDMGIPAVVDLMMEFPDVNSTPWEIAANNLISDPMDPMPDEMSKRWLYIMINNPNVFQEKIAFFWHDHFATSILKFNPNNRWHMIGHMDLLREKACGNLKDLLLSIARDPAMLHWLDGAYSVKWNPNENFARELWELFTLGEGNGYTENDIQQAARAFTGYKLTQDASGHDQLVQDDSRHDFGQKLVLGTLIPANNTIEEDYEEVIDITLNKKPVAEFVSKKIWEHFVYKDPSEECVAALAAILRNNNYELKPLLKTILLSKAFYSKTAKESMVRSPVESAIGWIRSTGMTISVGLVYSRLTECLQVPLQPPDVNGWFEDGEQWLSTQRLASTTNFYLDSIKGPNSLDAVYTPGADADAVVDLMARLLYVDMEEEVRDRYIGYLDTAPDQNGDGVPEPSPFAEASESERQGRVRGLYWIGGQHPSCLTK